MAERICENYKTHDSEEVSEEIYKELESLAKHIESNISSQGTEDLGHLTNEEEQEFEGDNHIIAAEEYLLSLYSCIWENSDVKVDENGLIHNKYL